MGASQNRSGAVSPGHLSRFLNQAALCRRRPAYRSSMIQTEAARGRHGGSVLAGIIGGLITGVLTLAAVVLAGFYNDYVTRRATLDARTLDARGLARVYDRDFSDRALALAAAHGVAVPRPVPPDTCAAGDR